MFGIQVVAGVSYLLKPVRALRSIITRLAAIRMSAAMDSALIEFVTG